MNIKPLEPNLIYEKIIHELHEKKDYIKGSLLINLIIIFFNN